MPLMRMRRWQQCTPLLRSGLTVLAAAGAAGRARAQQLTVERIFSSDFAARTADVAFMADGRRLQSFARNGDYVDVWVERIGSAQPARAIDGSQLVPAGGSRAITLRDIAWSGDEQRALILAADTQAEPAAGCGTFYVWDVASHRLVALSARAGMQQFAQFSPDGTQVAFVRAHDLYVADPSAGRELRLTTDGSDSIANGAGDRAYADELRLRAAFRWSPDGRRIAYWHFDETAVARFYNVDALALYPRVVSARYAQAGTPTARVELRVVDIATGRTIRIDAGRDSAGWLPRMQWIGPDELVIQRLNRRQNQLDVLLASAASGDTRTVLTERDSTWLHLPDDITWVRQGRQFLWSSERDGFRHIYLYARDGTLVRQLTHGAWDVSEIAGTDDAGTVFFTASEPGPQQKQLFAVGLDGKGLRRVSIEPGTHEVLLAPGGRYYVDTWSRAGVPPVTRLHSADGRVLRTLLDNSALASRLAGLELEAPEFFSFAAADGVTLNGWLIKPPGFDASRRYPVLLYVYGGPGSQTVTDAWDGARYLWHQLLAQQGIVVASVDGRGTGGRGRAFSRASSGQLGRLEARDQVEAARHMAALPWVDSDRIGIWGWSYGGYVAALSMMSSDAFRAGIAVAPVADWRLYDAVYAERFMGMPADRAQAYDESSLLKHAAQLRGRLLLVHGTGDPNVHFQNSLQLAAALQAAARSFDMMVYPDGTHSLSRGGTPIHLFHTLTDWLQRNLLRP